MLSDKTLSSLLKQAKLLQSTVDRAQEDKDESSRALSQSKADDRDKQRQLKILAAENESLKQACEQNQANQRRALDLRAKNRQLQESHDASRRRVKDLEETLAASQARAAALARTQQENERQRLEIKGLKSERSDWADAIRQYDVKFENEQRAYLRQIKALKLENSRLREKAQAAERQQQHHQQHQQHQHHNNQRQRKGISKRRRTVVDDD